MQDDDPNVIKLFKSTPRFATITLRHENLNFVDADGNAFTRDLPRFALDDPSVIGEYRISARYNRSGEDFEFKWRPPVTDKMASPVHDCHLAKVVFDHITLARAEQGLSFHPPAIDVKFVNESDHGLPVPPDGEGWVYTVHMRIAGDPIRLFVHMHETNEEILANVAWAALRRTNGMLHAIFHYAFHKAEQLALEALGDVDDALAEKLPIVDDNKASSDLQDIRDELAALRQAIDEGRATREQATGIARHLKAVLENLPAGVGRFLGEKLMDELLPLVIKVVHWLSVFLR